MDNRIISVQAVGREQFDLAFQLMFTTEWKEQKATDYFEHPEKGLIFFWHADNFCLTKGSWEKSPTIKLLTPMDWKRAADLAWDWLQGKDDKEYQGWSDHDGSNGKGFRIYNEDWGHVGGSHYAICAVLPIWAWYGK